MAARDFTELAAWQLAHELLLMIVAHEVRDHMIDGHARGYVTDDELAQGTRLSKRAAGATGALIRYLVNHPDAPE